jgi:Rrf2 family nitric oxide-sensitive transcriptional repressor
MRGGRYNPEIGIANGGGADHDGANAVHRVPADAVPVQFVEGSEGHAMRLTTYTDFCLRVLIFVAVRPDPLPTIAQIAESYDISKNHLMKVVHELGQAGYLATTRGKGGGLRLARPAESILLGELIRRTEPDMATAPCMDPVKADCVIVSACRLRKAMHEARVAFFTVLDSYTLADLAQNQGVLNELLSGFAVDEPARGRRLPAKPVAKVARKPALGTARKPAVAPARKSAVAAARKPGPKAKRGAS